MASIDGNSLIKPFIITVSARTLFDLEESHAVFTEQGIQAFEQYQKEREHEPLAPGPIFPLVKKLLALNAKLPAGARPFEVVLLSRNSTQTAVRVLNSIESLGLPLIRAIFTGGEPSSTYINAIGVDLFLSSNPEEVAKAVNECQIAGATILAARGNASFSDPEQIRIALDGDSVIFSDEAERIYGEGGLEEFQRHEHQNAHVPLQAGPFRGLLEAIHLIQQAFPHNQSPLRTALITARSMPAHMRAINTLSSWGVGLDVAMFLGGRPKAPYIRAFRADLFLDDSDHNIELAREVGPAGHVPFGVRNQSEGVGRTFSGGEVVPVSPRPVDATPAPGPSMAIAPGPPEIIAPPTFVPATAAPAPGGVPPLPETPVRRRVPGR